MPILSPMAKATWSAPEGASRGEIVRAWREWRELTQVELGALLGGVDQSAISEWEVAGAIPSTKNRERLARASKGLLPVEMWDGIPRRRRGLRRASEGASS